MPRPRVPVGERKYLNREPRTIPVATALSPREVEALDRKAGDSKCSRSEYIRRAIRSAMDAGFS